MKTGRGNKKWCSEDVIRTLKNEKYCGNAILQKTFKKDLLAKRESITGRPESSSWRMDMKLSLPQSSSIWPIRNLRREIRKNASILRNLSSLQRLSVVAVVGSMDQRSGIPPTSTAPSYGSATTSSPMM